MFVSISDSRVQSYEIEEGVLIENVKNEGMKERVQHKAMEVDCIKTKMSLRDGS